jgi:3-deoxy-D-manno-octulosonate 8-phosphate phosphatase KdsC-like HAD superfamily phosphatase
MDHVFMNAGNGKAQILCEICQKYVFTFDKTTYIDDTMNDLGIIELLIKENGTAACPANTMSSIQKSLSFIFSKQPAVMMLSTNSIK